MVGQRAGRADRAPGRCRAGEGVAGRRYLTGRLCYVLLVPDASLCAAIEPLVLGTVTPIKGRTMATKRNTPGRPRRGGSSRRTEREREEEALGEELLRVSREEQADFVAGWDKFMEQLGIRCKPIGAKKLRELLLKRGFNPQSNEFSQGIIALREE